MSVHNQDMKRSQDAHKNKINTLRRFIFFSEKNIHNTNHLVVDTRGERRQSQPLRCRDERKINGSTREKTNNNSNKNLLTMKGIEKRREGETERKSVRARPHLRKKKNKIT